MSQVFEKSPNSIGAGIMAVTPMLFGTAPFGIIFGAFAFDMGLGFPGTQGLSLFVFAGSSQFVGASLFGQGASIIVVIITTFFINLRHFLYGAAIGHKLQEIKTKDRIFMSFFLTDETFAIVSRFKEIRTRYYWGTALAMYINWQVWTFIGLLFADHLKGLVSMNLGFIMVPAFLPIIISQLKSVGEKICAIFSAFLSIVFLGMPNQTGLLLACVVSIITVLLLESLTPLNSSNSRD